jgi:hypothetical protein
MFAVLGAALVLYARVEPFRNEASFLFWVVAAYLFTLAVEILLLVRGTDAGQKTPEDRGV